MVVVGKCQEVMAWREFGGNWVAKVASVYELPAKQQTLWSSTKRKILSIDCVHDRRTAETGR